MLLVGGYGFGQNGQTNDSLEFSLTIHVVDLETEEALPCVTITIIGTDGSLRKYTPREGEKLDSIPLKPETSYSIVIELDGYLTIRGKETTVGLTQSKKFLHEYAIQPFMEIIIKLPKVEFEHNKFKLEVAMLDSLNYMSQIMIENPTIVVKAVAFQDSTEKKGISLLRAEDVIKGMIKLGIAPERLVVADNGIDPYIVSVKNRNPCKPPTSRTINCRCVLFMVVSDDYVPPK